jgi:hypothetical protein
MPAETEGAPVTRARVGCYAGSRAAEEPRWVEIDGVRCPVREVKSRWREPDRDGWRVTLQDGKRLIVYYVRNMDVWTLEKT